jgi:hypothetical protein
MKKNSTKDDLLKEDHVRAKVQERAYFIAQSEGFPHGKEFVHWIKAEELVVKELLGKAVHSAADTVKKIAGKATESASAKPTTVKPAPAKKPVASAKAVAPKASAKAPQASAKKTASPKKKA